MSAHLCPTCKRRLSERVTAKIVYYPKGYRENPGGHELEERRCPDPIHDLADAAPELAEALLSGVPREIRRRCIACEGSGYDGPDQECEYCGRPMKVAESFARALLAKLEVPRER